MQNAVSARQDRTGCSNLEPLLIANNTNRRLDPGGKRLWSDLRERWTKLWILLDKTTDDHPCRRRGKALKKFLSLIYQQQEKPVGRLHKPNVLRVKKVDTERSVFLSLNGSREKSHVELWRQRQIPYLSGLPLLMTPTLKPRHRQILMGTRCPSARSRGTPEI
ncbi:hypothetical protein BR93DRAFT_393816 [Coniochaeta sp. PMI_546]|nr:hypothetical protein BR93DRAFT_393816 [Coniochaeta sp. PMI_546]